VRPCRHVVGTRIRTAFRVSTRKTSRVPLLLTESVGVIVQERVAQSVQPTSVPEARDVVFLSKATPGDDELALWLAPKLEAAGYRVFTDIRTLEPGDRWRPADQAGRTLMFNWDRRVESGLAARLE
jgi:hypothetical protein